jgi:hypothetical protein
MCSGLVTASAADLAEARRRAYAAVARIDWLDAVFRRDIGLGPETIPSMGEGYSDLRISAASYGERGHKMVIVTRPVQRPDHA